MSKKYLLFVLPLLIGSCRYSKLQLKLHAKGYNISKDTIIIKPYEYFIKYPGYGIQYRELHPSYTTDVQVGIKGFEQADTIPVAVLKDTVELYFSDPGVRSFVSGEIMYRYRGGATTFYPRLNNIGTYRLSFKYVVDHFRRFRDVHFLLLWNFTIQKGDKNVVVPARKYIIRY